MKTGSTYQATSNTICTGTDGSSGTADQGLSSTPAFGWLCYIPEINGIVVPFCGGSKSFRKTGGWLPPTGRYTKRLRYSIARESADTTLLSALSKEHTGRSTVVDAAQYEGEALEVFRSHSDKRWSVADCANFVCIRERGAPLALSFDRDFVQAQGEFMFRALG